MDLNQATKYTIKQTTQNNNLNYRQFIEHNDIEKFRSDTNRNFSDRTFDINPVTLRYDKNCSTESTNRIQPINYQPNISNYIVEPSRNSQSIGPHESMSEQFRLMKHAQEKQRLQDSPDSNVMSMNHLKQQQALEIQRNLQTQNQFGLGLEGQDPLGRKIYADTSIKQIDQTYAYNAQGEAVKTKETLFNDRANKYLILKQMSPEMLNRIYGRQSDQSTLPLSSFQQMPESGDIYDQTSCFKIPQKIETVSHDQLNTQLEKRKRDILSQKSKLGIQSYSQNDYGTKIDDAFVSY
jgi:hypothetical protein